MRMHLGAVAPALALIVSLGLVLIALRAGPATATGATKVAPQAHGTASGCVVRFYDEGPRIHVDATHSCPGVSDVGVSDQGDLLLRRADQSVIQGVTVSADETLARRGIIAGASWTRATTRISFFDAASGKPVRADDHLLRGPTANIWIIWVAR